MDKEFFKDEGIIAPLLEHIKKRELRIMECFPLEWLKKEKHVIL